MRLVPSSRAAPRGITLIETLVYLTAWFLVMGVAMSVFYQFWDASKALRRRTDGLVAALRAGEAWRADIRRAAGRVEVRPQPEGELLRIPTAAGAVEWRFSAGKVWRREAPEGAWIQRLGHVRESPFAPTGRLGVACVAWEVELEPPRHGGRRAIPLRFLAVPPAPATP